MVVNHIGHATAPADFASMLAEVEAAGFPRDNLVEVEGDVTRPEASEAMVAAAVHAFGKLDVFVSNAGICQFADFLK